MVTMSLKKNEIQMIHAILLAHLNSKTISVLETASLTPIFLKMDRWISDVGTVRKKAAKKARKKPKK